MSKAIKTIRLMMDELFDISGLPIGNEWHFLRESRKEYLVALHPDRGTITRTYGFTPEDINFMTSNQSFFDFCRSNPTLLYREARTQFEEMNKDDTPWELVSAVLDHVISTTIFSPAHQNLGDLLDAGLNDRIQASRSTVEDLEIKLKVLQEVFDRMSGPLKFRVKHHITTTKEELQEEFKIITTLETAKKVLRENFDYSVSEDTEDA